MFFEIITHYYGRIAKNVNGRIIFDEIEDLYYNLALEHAIFHLQSQNNCAFTLRFWKNPMSVILGRNQNVTDEIDIDYCLKHGIIIGRRISGGGTVYEDTGILNISFFYHRRAILHETNQKVTQQLFTNLILECLTKIGLHGLEIEGLSNILFNKRKVSGAAGYNRRYWGLYHATLLISGNLVHMNNSLLAKNFNSKRSIQSRYMPTTNLPQFDIYDWKSLVIKQLEHNFQLSLKKSSLTKPELILAKYLKDKMYSQKSWIYNKQRIFIS